MQRYVRNNRIDLDLLFIHERRDLFVDMLRLSDEYRRENRSKQTRDVYTLASEILVFITPDDAEIEADSLSIMRDHLIDYLLRTAPKTITVSEASSLRGVSEQAIRNILSNTNRRATIFPGAVYLGKSPRGEWRIPEAEVEAWTPRRYPR